MDNNNAPPTYRPEPGTIEKAYCEACKQRMPVKRNVKRYYMRSKKQFVCDEFECQFRMELWHSIIVHLINERNATRSPTLKRILSGDIYDLRISGINGLDNE